MKHRIEIDTAEINQAAKLLMRLGQERENDANSHYLLEGWYGFNDAHQAYAAAQALYMSAAREHRRDGETQAAYLAKANDAERKAAEADEARAEAARDLADEEITARIEAAAADGMEP